MALGHCPPETGKEEGKGGKAELEVINNDYLIMPSACDIEIAHGDGALNSGLYVPYQVLG